MSSYVTNRSGGGGGNGVTTYSTFSAFPVSATNGALGLALDTDVLYAFNTGSMTWVVVGGPGAVLSIGTIDSTTASANGAAISTNQLIMQSASATVPGVVNTASQVIAGVKTFSSAPNLSSLTASQALVLDGSKNVATLAYTSANTGTTLVERDGSGNFSAGIISATLTGTASGNLTLSVPHNHGVLLSGTANATSAVTPDASTTKVLVSGGIAGDPSWQDLSGGALALGTFGAVPNTSGASLSGATLTLQPADSTKPGGVSNVTQTFGGGKTVLGNTDEVQLTVKGNATQTSDILDILRSDNTVLFKVTNAGAGTFTGALSASNLSGTNTGDVTLAAFGSTPSSTGASLSGQALTLQPADATNPGGVSIADQTFAGNKAFLGIESIGGTLAVIEPIIQASIVGLGINTTDTTVTQTQTGGTWGFALQNVLTGAAQAAGQIRGGIKANLYISPVALTSYGGIYNGFQFTGNNTNGNITGTMRGAVLGCTTFAGATTAIQTGMTLTSNVLSTGIVQTAKGLDITNCKAIGTDTVAHASVGVLVGSTAITASGSSTSNTATGIQISNNITATGTSPTVYAINSLSTAQSVFAGTVTASSLSGSQLTSTVATGTPPLVVASTTQVANLNAATAGTSTVATTVTTTATNTTNASFFPTFVASSTSSNQGIDTATGLSFNPSTNIVSTTGLNLSGLTASQAVVTDVSKNLASLAYTNANTVSTLVQRDGSGNFSAGTITAALTGTASGNTTYTASQYGVVLSGAGNAMSVLTPDASTTKVLTSGGASANPSWQTVPSAPTFSSEQLNLGLSVTASAGTITVALKQADGSTDPSSGAAAVNIGFRDVTSTSGDYVIRSITSALSLTLAGASTLGGASGAAYSVYVYAFDNSGTITLGASLTSYDEGSVQSSSTTATSNQVIYQASALSNKPVRLIGRFVATNTAAAWASPTEVSLITSSLMADGPIYLNYTGNAGTVITGSTTPIDFTTKVVDSHNAWNGTTFTAPRSGFYSCAGSAKFTIGIAGLIFFYLNGGQKQLIGGQNGAVVASRYPFSGAIYLTVGDAITILSDTSGTLSNSATEHSISIWSQ